MNMQFLFQYAFSLVGNRYQYGGDDPIGGFDCSGFVQELLMAAGVIKRGTPKMNAQMIFNFFETKGGQGVYSAGSIAFFGAAANKITHIGFCLDSNYMLHAGSGDSSTLSEARAIQQNAFVRMDEIKYRKDFLCVVKPTYRGLGN